MVWYLLFYSTHDVKKTLFKRCYGIVFTFSAGWNVVDYHLIKSVV